MGKYDMVNCIIKESEFCSHALNWKETEENYVGKFV